MGRPQPSWGRAGPWLPPCGPSPACRISSLSLGAPQSPRPGKELAVQRGRALGGRAAGLPPPLICRLLLLGPGRCSHWRAQGRPGHQAQGQGPRSCLHLSLRCIWTPASGPSAPPESRCAPQGQHGRQARGATPPVLGGDPPPWDACKPGPPKSQGAERTSQEESQMGPPPSPAPARARSDPPRPGAEAPARVRRPSAGRQAGARAQAAAGPGSGPRGAGEGRCGRAP